nr:MAG TPA: hypothetical protein [Caudoviricetes sp.]
MGCVHVHVWCESLLDRLLGPFTAVLRVGGVWVCAGRAPGRRRNQRIAKDVRSLSSPSAWELGA